MIDHFPPSDDAFSDHAGRAGPTEVGGARGDRAAAERRYHGALALADELGARPLVGQCHLGLARLGRRASQRQTRPQHLAAALAILDALGMPFWREQAEAEARRPRPGGRES